MTARDSSQQASMRVGAWLIVVLLIPRIVRMLFPEIWVEDDFYLESAWLVSVGMRPYLDFVQPHMPLLEWIAAGYLKLFGASYLSIEILNEAAIFATSILTFALARRVAGRPTAIAASILYAYSSLGFRYHAYERESFVAPLILLGAIVTLDEAMPAIRQAVFVALIFFVACAIKLTAGIAFPVMVIFIAVAYRRIGGALVSGAIFALALATFGAILYRLYGNEFIFQTFVFHFLKGRDLGLNTALFPRMILDVLVPLFVLGCWQIFANRIFNRGVILVLAIVAAEYAFYGLLSPTAWAHNYLEPLPFIAIIAGIGAIALVQACRTLHDRGQLFLLPIVGALLVVIIGTFLGGFYSMLLVMAFVVLLVALVLVLYTPAVVLYVPALLASGMALIVICLLGISPIINESWLHGAVYGFGFVPRAEISQIADALRAASKSDEEVIAPSFVCFEANRRELIRYPETYGVYREAKAEYERDGFFAARRRMGATDFFQLISDTRHYWTDQMREAIASGKVSAVINDSPVQLVPLVLVPEDFLASNGFRPTLITDHFTLWTRTPAPAATSSP